MKRILRVSFALLLTFSLIFSSLIFASAEIAGTDVTDEASFFAAIADKASVINIKNGFTISSSTSPEINFNTTIKGNGNKIILGARIKFSGGISTVDNLQVERANGNDCYNVYGSAAVTIVGGVMRQFSTSGDNACISIHQDFDGVVNVTGGAQMSAYRYLLVSETKGTTKGGTINLLNCTFNATGSGDSVKLRSGQTINIGNTANGEKTVLNLTGDGFYMNDTASSVINIYDGAVINCASHFSNLNASGTPMINVYGGSITCANRLFLSQQKAIFNVYGGTLKSTSTENGRIFALRSGSSAVVMGGTFTNGASAPLDPDESSSLKIAGGSFNFNPSAYLAGNYASSNSNGTYSVALSLGTPVNVASASELSEAITNQAPYIKITAPISLSEAAVFRYDAYIDGGNNLLTNNQIATYDSVVVTLKDVNIERASDVIRIDNNSHVTISGGTIYCTGTSFNNGAIYVTDKFTGRVVVTDDAVIKADKLYAFYTGGDNSTCAGGMVEFIDCEVTTNCEKGTFNVRSNIAVTIGGGTEGQTANITNKNYKVFINNDKGWGAVLNIKDGAVITQTSGAYAIHLNKTTILNMTGGKINSKGQGIVVDAQNSFASVSGGTFVTTNENCIQKNNGALLVSGGDFTSNYSSPAAIYSSTRSEKAGAFLIDAANITLADGTALLSHNGAFYTVISNADIEQDGVIIDILANGGDITLNNCKLTSADNTITSANSAVIRLENNTVVASTGNEPIVGGTVEVDATSSIGVPALHPLAQLIKDDTDGVIEVNVAYTDVPAITLDKDLTFTGTGSIAFANAGFEVNGVDVVFAEGSNITVTMAADDKDGANRLFNLTNGATLTLSGGTFTGYIRMAGTSSQSAREKVIVNDGATLIQKNFRIFDASNGYNEVEINGGTFKGSSNSSPMLRMNDGTAVVKIYGGTFDYSGTDVIMNIGNVGTLEVGKLATDTEEAKGPTMTTSGSNSLIFYFNTSSGIQNSSAVVNFNAGKFTQNAYGYNIFFNKAAKAPININGGTWTTRWLATVYVNDGGITDLRINGGTFETKNGDEQTVYKKNGALTVTGGHFIGSGKAATICSAPDTNAGAFTVNDAANDISNITFKHNGSGALLEHRSAVDFNIIDTNITNTGSGTGAGVLIEKRTNANITIENSNITTDGSALALGSDFTGATNATVEVINSTLTSTGSRGIDNKWGVAAGVGDTNYYSNIPNFTMDSTSKIIDSAELRTNGKPKMFRFAGGSGDANTVAVSATTASLASGTYTLTLNYRETGGAWPYVGVTAGGKTTKITAENADTFADGVIVYTFSAEGEVKVSLGRETMHSAGAVYFGNVKLTADGSTTNLLTDTLNNADLARSPINTLTAGNAGAIIPGWTNENLASFHGARVMEIPCDDFFTADNPKVAENYVYKFEDGDNLDVLLRFHMTEDTNYEFSYNYMSSDGNLRNKLYQGGMDRPFSMDIEQDEKTYKTIVKYTLGNDGDSTVENEGTTIYIDGPDDAYGSIQYLGNFEMYEIDGAGNRITGRNLLAGFSPMYEAEGDLSHLGTYPMVTDSSVSSKLENAYGVYFRNDSSETDVASIVKVDDNFFKKTTFAERRGNARRYLIENESHTDLAYDYSADKAVNVIDLLKVKKYESGFVGADDKAEALKNEILNAADIDATGKTVYYVSNSGSDSNTGTSKDKPLATLEKAISKASAGNYILLERGGEWRMPSSTDGQGWKLTKGVTIGSYGTGDKPLLIGSAENYADSKWAPQWKKVDGTDNIWKITLDNKGSANIPGNVYFFTNKTDKEPALVGTIIKDGSLIGQTWNTSTSEWDKVSKTPAEILSRNGEVFRDYDAEEASWLEQLLGISGKKNDVYVYYDGNLTEDFKKIEITESRDLFFADSVSGITIDNIAIKYVGAHGINFRSCTNATISNCEIGWIGGSPSGNSALGNGIQFGVSGTDLIATHNYIYECYDAGITPQNWKTSSTTNYNFENVQITNNLLTNNFDNIEFWNDDGSMEMKVDGNILKDAAYCWSWEQRCKTGNVSMFGCHVYGGRNAYNNKLQLEFTNNIFDNTQANIFCWFWGNKDNAAELPNTFPTREEAVAKDLGHYMHLEGNSYYQKAGSNAGGQVNYYGKTTDPAYASSQKAFKDVVGVLDPDAAKAGRVTYLQQWLTDLAEQGDNEMVYKNITVNGANISDYVIVNETSTEYGTLSVNNAIKAVTGEYLAVADSVPANGKAIRIITNTALAPNTVKVYVNNGTLYIAAHDTLFVDDAISVFKGILEDGKLTFANGYEKTITLSSYTYSGKSGLRLIGDSDKNPVSYNVGETATINIAGYASSGQIISVPQFKVTIYNEATGQTTTKTYSGTTGVCSFDVACKDAQGNGVAGFVYWTVVACDSNGNKISGFAEVDSGVHYSGSVGFGVKSIAKSSDKPTNFDSNWSAAATEVASTSATASVMESVSANSGYEAYRVVIPYANAGGFVTGYLTYPKNASANSLGLMVRFQGNSVAIPDKNYDANAAVFTVCAHSMDLTYDSSEIAAFRKTIEADKGVSNFAWDNANFNDSYLVKMIKRDLLAGKFMTEYFTSNGLWNGTSITAKGTSMGGFQAIAVAALLDDVTGKEVTTLDVSLPWLCDLNAGASGVNKRKGQDSWRPDYDDVTKYVDTVNFATMLGNVDEIIVNAGLGDDICPASGVMAFYNTIVPDKQTNKISIRFRQNNTHGGGYDGAYYTIVG